MFPFISYDQFLETGTDPGANSHPKFNETDHAFENQFHTESEIDVMLKKSFINAPYPTNLLAANIFCPFCGKQIASSQPHLTYTSSNYQRKFLAHQHCLNQNSSELLNDVFEEVDEMQLLPYGFTKKMKPLNIGERQFCMELMISHPLSNYKFIKLVSKGILQVNTIRWTLRQDDELFCYLPNIICFPFVDFKVTISLSEIGCPENKTQLTYYINLARNQYSNKVLKAYSEDLSIELKIYSTDEEKKNLINMMNYKYKFSEDLPLPLVEITALEIEIPESMEVEDEESNSTIVELLSEKNQSIASSVHSSIHSSVHSSMHSMINSVMSSNQNFNAIHYNNEKIIEKSPSSEKEKVDLEKLIKNGDLSSFVRNNVQSRLFQDYLDKATEEEIELIIKHLEEELKDLITDEYANYMMQKLFGVCTPQQRNHIMRELAIHIPNIARNKQGTHTIQAFIGLFIEREEYQLAQLVCNSIKPEYENLSIHPFSTHFIQSIMKIFPLDNIIEFFWIAQKNFLAFALDKNAMCVLKHMMRRMKKQENSPLIMEVRKNLINSITLNTDKIIQDSYGNYVIQFCYELFGQSKSSGITEMIIEKFVQFSLQKYSSSVVSKCLATYWKDKSYPAKIKEVLKIDGVLEMYRNREGNKILLDLLEKYEHTTLRDRILNSLPIGESSKFYYERWGVQQGVRSGPVGIEARSFTQADAMNKKQRKK